MHAMLACCYANTKPNILNPTGIRLILIHLHRSCSYHNHAQKSVTDKLNFHISDTWVKSGNVDLATRRQEQLWKEMQKVST